MTDQPVPEHRSAKQLALIGCAVAILSCVVAKVHATRTWHGENYERVITTMLILAFGCLTSVILSIVAFVQSRGCRAARLIALLSMLGAFLIPAAGFFWLLA